MMKDQRRTGFTLIELLVVIAIIAILAAILFPVFAKARERANATACMSNMKQIGIAIYTYLQDNDECYPLNRFPAPGFPVGGSLDGSPYTWKNAVAPFLKSVDVLRCPSNPARIYKDASGNWPRSYAYNGAVFHEYTWGSCVPCTLGKIKDPSNTLFIVETRGPWSDLGDWCLGPPTGPYWYKQPTLGVFNIHMGRMVALFADTHARSIKLRETMGIDFADQPYLWQDGTLGQAGRTLNTTLAYRRAVANGMPDEYK